METEYSPAVSEMRLLFDLQALALPDIDVVDNNSRLKKNNHRSKTIAASTEDLKVVHNLNRLDKLVMKFGDPEKYDELLWDVQQGIIKRLDIWLSMKGVSQECSAMAACSDVYLTFIYGVKHDKPLTLKRALGQTLVAFMFHYLLRNRSTKPYECALYPSAIRWLYLFLQEKGYLIPSAEIIVALIDKIEPCFLYLLREMNYIPQLKYLTHEI